MHRAVIVRRALIGASLFCLLLAGPASAANSTVLTVDPGNNFSPSTKTVSQGDRVRWSNPDVRAATTTRQLPTAPAP